VVPNQKIQTGYGGHPLGTGHILRKQLGHKNDKNPLSRTSSPEYVFLSCTLKTLHLPTVHVDVEM
jgi:hypothetical protein